MNNRSYIREAILNSVRGLFLLGLFGSACTVVESIGTMDSDSPALHTPVETDEDTGTEEPLLLERIDFVSAAQEGDEYIWIAPEENALEVGGIWYDYNDDISIVERFSDGEGGVCGIGEIVPSDEDNWRYVGLGFNMCNSGLEGEPSYESYSLGECPFVADFENRLAGISFEVTGALPEGLLLSYKEPERLLPPYSPILTAGRRDYFISDGTPHPRDSTPLNVFDMHAFQFELWNVTDAPISFDFCISGMQLIVVESL